MLVHVGGDIYIYIALAASLSVRPILSAYSRYWTVMPSCCNKILFDVIGKNLGILMRISIIYIGDAHCKCK